MLLKEARDAINDILKKTCEYVEVGLMGDNSVCITTTRFGETYTIVLTFDITDTTITLKSWMIDIPGLTEGLFDLPEAVVSAIVRAHLVYNKESPQRPIDEGVTCEIITNVEGDFVVHRKKNYSGRFELMYDDKVKRNPYLYHWKYILIAMRMPPFTFTPSDNIHFSATKNNRVGNGNYRGYMWGHRWTYYDGKFDIVTSLDVDNISNDAIRSYYRLAIGEYVDGDKIMYRFRSTEDDTILCELSEGDVIQYKEGLSFFRVEVVGDPMDNLRRYAVIRRYYIDQDQYKPDPKFIVDEYYLIHGIRGYYNSQWKTSSLSLRRHNFGIFVPILIV